MTKIFEQKSSAFFHFTTIVDLPPLDVYDTLVEVIMANKAYIEELISKAKQKKHNLDVFYSIANNEKSTLESKTLYNVHSSLEDIGLIKKVAMGKYKINDIFLNIYLRNKTFLGFISPLFSSL